MTKKFVSYIINPNYIANRNIFSPTIKEDSELFRKSPFLAFFINVG